MFHENRWKETSSVAEDVNSEYSDLDNMSDIPHGTNVNNVGSSLTNTTVDTSHARGHGSRVFFSPNFNKRFIAYKCARLTFLQL